MLNQVLALALLAQSGPAPELASIIEGASGAIRSLQLDYEGTVWLGPPGGDREDGAVILDDFSGKYAFRGDWAQRQETYHRNPSAGEGGQTEQWTETMATLKDKTQWYQEQAGILGGSKIAMQNAMDFYKDSTSYGRLFVLPMLRLWSRAPRTRVAHEGTRMVDGHPCERFAVIYGKNHDQPNDPESHIDRFDLDMSCDGQVRRAEFYRSRGRLAERLVDVELQSFRGQDGSLIWIPVAGRHEVFVGPGRGKEVIFHDRPTNTVIHAVMASSVRVNVPMPDEFFVLKLRDGTPVRDLTAKERRSYRVGEEKRPPPTSLEQAEEQLVGLLREADAQGDELKATSRQRSGEGFWITAFPWLLAGAATGSLVWVLIRRRKAP